VSADPPEPPPAGGSSVADALSVESERVREQVATLERDVARVVAASEDSNADDEHDPEGATIAFERAQLMTLLDAARARLRDVETALGRLAEGGYGRCEVCGRPIDPERLVARPTASRCIDCARAAGSRVR
jgi:DnaK suppressor protein